MEIKTTVRQFILDNYLRGAQGPRLEDTTPLITSGIIDSVGVIDLLNFVEGQFGIEFMPGEIDRYHLNTVEQIDRIVREKLQSKCQG
jgi:acyl carrier protein